MSQLVVVIFKPDENLFHEQLVMDSRQIALANIILVMNEYKESMKN